MSSEALTDPAFPGVAFHNVAELEAVAGWSGRRLVRVPSGVRQQMDSRGRWIAAQAAHSELRFVAKEHPVQVALSSLHEGSTIVLFRGEIEMATERIPPGSTHCLRLEAPPNFSHAPVDCLTGAFSPDVWRIQCWGDTIVHHVDGLGHSLRLPQPQEAPTKRWLAYGSSITHGFPGSYIDQTARRLGLDPINLGMSGACRMEPAFAHWIANIGGWDIATLELGINVRGAYTPQRFRELAGSLIHELASKHPQRPIGVMTIFPNYATWAQTPEGQNERAFNEILLELTTSFRNLHAIDGLQVVGGHLRGMAGDLVHPTLWGSTTMGENLAAALKPLL